MDKRSFSERIWFWPFVLLLLFIAGMGIVFFWRLYFAPEAVEVIRPEPSKHAPVVCTVFIHGTVGSSLSVFNPLACLKDDMDDNTRSARASRVYRNHEHMCWDQALLAEGWQDITTEELEACRQGTLEGSKSQKAAYIKAATYDWCANYIEKGRYDRQYATFGWSGLLSQRERKKAAYQLYSELIAYRDRIKAEKGVVPLFHLVTHSHGGNVALWLPDIEHKKKRGLAVDLLVMLGTPIQVETAPACLSPFFKKILLYCSHGDAVQRADRFSTRVRKSYMKMSDLVDFTDFFNKYPDCVRADIVCVVNHNLHHIDHTNMWLVGRSHKFLQTLDPLPLAVLLPLFEPAFEKQHCSQTGYHLMIEEDEGACTAHVTCNAHKKEIETVYHTENVMDLLLQLHTYAECGWQCSDTWRHVVFNRKNYLILKHFFGKVPQESTSTNVSVDDSGVWV